MARANVDRSAIEVLRRRVYPTTGTDVIYQGDILVVSSGNARPASTLTTADAVADAFIGIAIHAKRADATPDIVVGVDVVAEMDCSALASAANVGDAVEIMITGGAAVNQEVTVASTNPIGKVAYKEAIGATTLRCHFVGKGVASPVVAD